MGYKNTGHHISEKVLEEAPEESIQEEDSLIASDMDIKLHEKIDSKTFWEN